MIGNFSKYRRGCIFVVDYSTFSNVQNYFELVGNFKGISEVILKKIQQIGNFDRQLCFGFSFGSRLCIEIGLLLGNQTLKQMDLCEPAGTYVENKLLVQEVNLFDPFKALALT